MFISAFWISEIGYYIVSVDKSCAHLFSTIQFSSVQSLSRVWLFATPWIAARQASLSIANSQSSHRLMLIESVMPPSHLIVCHPLLLLLLIPPRIRVFSNESTLCMTWPKYWSFSFSISLSNEHSNKEMLISPSPPKKKTDHNDWIILGWSESMLGFSCNISWKSLNKLFGQPNKIGTGCLLLNFTP